MPASLIASKEIEVGEYLKHWKFKPPEMISYQKLGMVGYKTWLEDYRPDLIILDEAHRIKNATASVSRRVKRYMQGYPETCVVALSGTMFERKLSEVAHICDYCLGDGSPLPVVPTNVDEWGSALDEKISQGMRMHPGALVQLLNDEERTIFHSQPREAARKAFGRRLRDTPGVIVTGEQEGLQIPLVVRTHTIGVSPETDEYFGILRNDWETPDGHPFEFAPQLWAHARELACGFYMRWNPRPPQDWLNARKDWSWLIRESIKYKKCDSMKDVMNSIMSGQIKDPHGILDSWLGVKPTFTPNSEVVWHDDSALEWVLGWAGSNKGIIWVEHRGFGLRVAKALKARYFNAQGRDDYGPVEETTQDKEGHIICSIASNHYGRNLQHGWDSNLITSPPSTPGITEQLLGRTHRSGQKKDIVTADFMLGCKEHWDGFYASISGAEHAKDQVSGSRKLLIATIEKSPYGTGNAWA
jgi:hypothetical protein